jgi:hypothetical protein
MFVGSCHENVIVKSGDKIMNETSLLKFIQFLRDEPFQGWTDESRNGYLTALKTIEAAIGNDSSSNGYWRRGGWVYTESKCKSCGAPIIWATTVAEKKIPLNAEYEMKFVEISTSSRTNLVVQLRKNFSSHFETCPNADKHRKKKQPQTCYICP